MKGNQPKHTEDDLDEHHEFFDHAVVSPETELDLLWTVFGCGWWLVHLPLLRIVDTGCHCFAWPLPLTTRMGTLFIGSV